MSFDISWDRLNNEGVNEAIKQFLAEQFAQVPLPLFIANLSVSSFSVGSVAPEISIRHIGDPFDDFYNDSDSEPGAPSLSDSESENEHMETTIQDHYSFSEVEQRVPNYTMNSVGLGNFPGETPTQVFQALRGRRPTEKKSDTDIQFVLEIKYLGDAHLDTTVDLLVNYPSSSFITLPIKLHITELQIHLLAAVAYLERLVFVSFLCDLNGDADSFAHPQDGSRSSTPHLSNFTDYAAGNNERIDVIKSMKIESEIGEVESNVLRNVGKVEKFLVEQFRAIIRDEVAWPNWVCFDLSEAA